MVEVPSIVIFIGCLIGCGYHSYFLGRKVGMSQCLEYLQEQGIITLDGADEDGL
jgi:hypothetical protein